MWLVGRANADEMAASLQELGTMQTTAAELRGRILDVDSGLNRVGKAYLHHLTDWQEHTAVTGSLTRSLKVGLSRFAGAFLLQAALKGLNISSWSHDIHSLCQIPIQFLTPSVSKRGCPALLQQHA